MIADTGANGQQTADLVSAAARLENLSESLEATATALEGRGVSSRGMRLDAEAAGAGARAIRSLLALWVNPAAGSVNPAEAVR